MLTSANLIFDAITLTVRYILDCNRRERSIWQLSWFFGLIHRQLCSKMVYTHCNCSRAHFLLLVSLLGCSLKARPSLQLASTAPHRKNRLFFRVLLMQYIQCCKEGLVLRHCLGCRWKSIWIVSSSKWPSNSVSELCSLNLTTCTCWTPWHPCCWRPGNLIGHWKYPE